jgi:hypothetical protein
LLNYLNKKKGSGDDIQGVPVMRSSILDSKEETKTSGGTLYQMMGAGGSSKKEDY